MFLRNLIPDSSDGWWLSLRTKAWTMRFLPLVLLSTVCLSGLSPYQFVKGFYPHYGKQYVAQKSLLAYMLTFIKAVFLFVTVVNFLVVGEYDTDAEKFFEWAKEAKQERKVKNKNAEST